MRFSYADARTKRVVATRVRRTGAIALVLATACGGSDGGTGTTTGGTSEGSGSTTTASSTTATSTLSEGSSGSGSGDTTSGGSSSTADTSTSGASSSESGSSSASSGSDGSGSGTSDTGAVEPNPACVAGCAVEFECGTEWGSARECVTWCDANLDAAAMFAQACRDAWEDLSACFGTLSCEEFQAYQAAEMIPYPCQSEAEALAFECEGQ